MIPSLNIHLIREVVTINLYLCSRMESQARNYRGGGGDASPALFQKLEKSALILEKMPWLWSSWVLISHLKCGFMNFQEKKAPNFSLRGLSFLCCTWNVYRSALIPGKLPCPEKFLVARLSLISKKHHWQCP